MLKLAINTKGKPRAVDEALLQAVVAEINKNIQLASPATVNLGFVSARRMRQLNRDYSGQDEPTDVLSFHYQPPGALDTPAGVMGDVVINTEAATRQAKTAGTNITSEVALLLTHGLLHLLGYDHQTKEDQVAMDDLQAKVLATLKLTYRRFWPPAS